MSIPDRSEDDSQESALETARRQFDKQQFDDPTIHHTACGIAAIPANVSYLTVGVRYERRREFRQLVTELNKSLDTTFVVVGPPESAQIADWPLEARALVDAPGGDPISREFYVYPYRPAAYGGHSNQGPGGAQQTAQPSVSAGPQ